MPTTIRLNCPRSALEETHPLTNNQEKNMTEKSKTYLCIVCGFIYDETLGRPDEGIAPGTLWQDVPQSWTCPECGVGKEDFELIEI
jgi:rubredoxin